MNFFVLSTYAREKRNEEKKWSGKEEMQKFIFIGNLTRDVELSETPGGIAVAKFTVAVGREYAAKGEERGVDYFNVVAFRGLAENIARYCRKGSKVCVIGQVQNSSYKNKEGVTVYKTEILAERVEFLGGRENGGEGKASAGATAKSGDYGGQVELIDGDDLPF